MKKIHLLFSLTVLVISNGLIAQENTISEQGNIGLGTVNPTERLQVAGRVRIDSTLVVSDSVNMTSSARVGADLKVDGNLYLPNITELNSIHTELILLTNSEGQTEKSTIEALNDRLYSKHCSAVGGIVPSPSWANGPNKLYSECPEVFVGIGTSTPGRSLDVVGNAKVSINSWVQGSLSIGADENSVAKVNLVNTYRPIAIQVRTSGNSVPYQRLMFFEYDNPDTKIMEVINTATNKTPFLLKGNGQMEIHNGTGKIFHLGTNGMFELSDGTTQTFRVETTGLIRGRRMKLDLNTWADYVFEENYRLMPLSEVENYIKTQKHLPNVPSEQELKVDGADVMEMNKILMEKVEELTLYLIQQNKNTEELKKQLEALQVKIAAIEATN
jgi:hypothetical protein